MMGERTTVQQMWSHVFWADGELLEALTSGDDVPSEAVREFAHILGTEEVWLSRLEYRSPSLAVWPALSSADLEGAVRQTHERWKLYLDRIQQSELLDSVTYTNSAGLRFDNQIGDILIHVALHGQYHRGKVNLMLRKAGVEPAPVDYIAFVRGAPAATEADHLPAVYPRRPRTSR
jgi:uncharacterized damage-inducible protein DinB